LLKKIARSSDSVVERYLPDPFILVLILTLIVFVAGILVQGQGPLAMIRHWGGGFWGLLEFSMQMVLVLVTGWVLASSPPVRRILAAIAAMAQTPG
jgi:short-chain fatty acids transporter